MTEETNGTGAGGKDPYRELLHGALRRTWREWWTRYWFWIWFPTTIVTTIGIWVWAGTRGWYDGYDAGRRAARPLMSSFVPHETTGCRSSPDGVTFCNGGDLGDAHFGRGPIVIKSDVSITIDQHGTTFSCAEPGR